jgi:indole-3-glycerol phosphate synthase
VGELGVLGRIAESVARRVEALKKSRPVSALRDEPLYARKPLSLDAALHGEGPRIIAEVKFHSPSEGVLRPNPSAHAAADIAHAYARTGAAAISILTEQDHFKGDPSFLTEARKELPNTPLLMKDFMIDPYQFELARSIGADAVLLIAALLGPRLSAMLGAAHALGLSVLIEAHDEAEAEAALAAGDAVIGVNSRDLKTLHVDLAVAHRLAPLLKGRTAVAESGLRSRADIDALSAVGYKGFLVGTSFMKSPYPAVALQTFLR